MRKLVCLILALFLGACAYPRYEFSMTSHDFTYEDVSHKKIEWEEILKQKDEIYCVYIYQIQCLHCQQIKNFVISFALLNLIPIYFIHYDSSIPRCLDNSNIICVEGVPLLFKIVNGCVVNEVLGSEAVLHFLLNEFARNIGFKLHISLLKKAW